MHAPSEDTLVRWQQDLEDRLRADTSIHDATGRISSPDVHEAAAAYVTRPSKRLLGMAFLHAAHALNVDVLDQDLTTIAAALEIRHGAILLHDDIVDRDEVRGGHATAHHALLGVFGAEEAGSAALLAGDVLAAVAPLPILDTALPARRKAQLLGVFQQTTARVAAGQVEQLHLDTRRAPLDASEAEILRIHAGQFAPYLLCSIQLACVLADMNEDTVSEVFDAGVPLCQGFQLQNDLAGFTELLRVVEAGSSTVLTLANTSDLARRRRTVVVRSALHRLQGRQRDQLSAYLAGAEDDLALIAALVRNSGAPGHCVRLIEELHADAHSRISTVGLDEESRQSLCATWRYMTDLYDSRSPVSRLYLRARPDLQGAGL